MTYTYKLEIELLAEDGFDAEDQLDTIRSNLMYNEYCNVMRVSVTDARDENGESV